MEKDEEWSLQNCSTTVIEDFSALFRSPISEREALSLRSVRNKCFSNLWAQSNEGEVKLRLRSHFIEHYPTLLKWARNVFKHFFMLL